MSTQDNYSFGSAASTAATIDKPSQTPVGSYPDPENPAQQGYWDGKQLLRTRVNYTDLAPTVAKFSIWSLVLTIVPFPLLGLMNGLLGGTGPWPEPVTVAIYTVIFSMGVSGFALGINAYSGYKKVPGAVRGGTAITSSILGGLFFGTTAYYLLFGGPDPSYQIVSGLALVVGVVVWLVAKRKIKQASAN